MAENDKIRLGFNSISCITVLNGLLIRSFIVVS